MILDSNHRYPVTMSRDEWDKVIQYQKAMGFRSVSMAVRSMCLGFLDLQEKEKALNFVMDLPIWKDEMQKILDKMNGENQGASKKDS